jgi:hypothetical protein
MVLLANIYLRFYMKLRVDTFLRTPTPPQIPSDSDSNSTALRDSTAGGVCVYIYYLLLSPWEARLSLINIFYFRSFRIYANNFKIGSDLKFMMSKSFSPTNRPVCVCVCVCVCARACVRACVRA